MSRELDPGWLRNWRSCAPHLSAAVVDAHARTVFGHIAGRGVYAALPGAASGILTENLAGTHAGLFSLVVSEDRRGEGLGRELVLALLAATRAPRVYLQVLMDNAVALGLYHDLGFRPICSYQHLLAPPGWTQA